MYDTDVPSRRIRANHSESMPVNILVLDTETEFVSKGEEQFHRMRLGWTVFARRQSGVGLLSEEWRFWDSSYRLWKYAESLTRDKTVLYLFGNNIYFDLQSSDFFYYMSLWGWKLDFFYESGLTYILCIRKGKASIKVLSVTNFWQTSVDDLGKMVGKGKAHPDLFSDDTDLISCYCFRDTEICLDAMEYHFAFLERNDLGSFGMTRASQAYRAWRHRFYQHDVFYHAQEDITSLERKAYYGGRTECFFIGECKGGPFVYLDVNSMYPHVMRTFPMPFIVERSLECPSLRDVTDITKHYSVIAEVEIDTDVPIYPYRTKDKILFPVGRFTTDLCTGSLRIALRRGHVRKVNTLVIYQHDILFSDYVDFFYTMRKECKSIGDILGDRQAKLFMNSLYGRFALQTPVLISDSVVDDPGYSREDTYDTVLNRWITRTTMFHREIAISGVENAPSSMVAISAHVTDYGRIMLWDYIEKAGREHVLYCDTDGFWIAKHHAESLKSSISGSRLGALKIDQTVKSLIIRGAKDYVKDGTEVLKGVPKNAEALPDRNYRYTMFLRQRSHLERRESRHYITQTVVKHISGAYDKGVTLSDGRVRPYRFPEELSASP